jgi:zinc-ribbon domain
MEMDRVLQPGTILKYDTYLFVTALTGRDAMYCPNCGTRVEEGQSFCSSCGKPVGATPATPSSLPYRPYQGRVTRHIQVVAILWLVWSILGLARGAGFIFFRGFALHYMPFSFPGRFWMMPFTALIGTVSLAYGVLGIIAAWGLYERLAWARILTLIIAFLSLIHIPFGTALGIYTLWVLLPAESGEEYRRICRPA